MSIPTLLTVPEFAKRHPTFPIGSLRWHLFHREKNGMQDAGVVIVLGKRKVLIDEERFFAWIRDGQRPVEYVPLNPRGKRNGQTGGE